MARWVRLFASVTIVAVIGAMQTGLARAQEEDDSELVLRVQRAEEQVRQLTGQLEQLQFRNRQLEMQLQQAGGGQANAAAPGAARGPAQPAPLPPVDNAAPPVAGPPPIVIDEPAPRTSQPRGDVFDPSANPDAPGAPRQLGTMRGEVGAPGGRDPGSPLDLGRQPGGSRLPPGGADPGLATAPPSQTPKDVFDLGYGYVLRKDYALAEQTFNAFLTNYPSDPMAAEAQYWLGEARFQRQNFREAAAAFLVVSTKHPEAARAPEALLRLGQSLVAFGEKEAGCATLGEVVRKYPRASAQVKQGVAREQKRSGC